MTGIGEAIRDRLGDLARRRGENVEALLTRWVGERLLARIPTSRYHNRLALKGAHLFTLWDGELFRTTSGVDLHAVPEDDTLDPLDVVSEIAAAPCAEPDGVVFNHLEVRDRNKVSIQASLGGAEIHLRTSIISGRPATPGVESRWYPGLLPGFRPAHLLCDTRETFLAEKLAIAVEFGGENTRLRDYCDLWYLSSRYWFSGHLMLEALERTFGHRAAGDILHGDDGYWERAFSPSFATDARERDWQRWHRRQPVRVQAPSLSDALTSVAAFARPLLVALRTHGRSPGRWQPGTGWRRP